MLFSYFRTALRTFLKHKSYTALNIAGLSLGIVASLFIWQYVKYERSYDTFHSKAENIYRVQYNQYQNGKLRFECAAAVPAVGPALKNNFPEVVQFTRLFPVSGVMSYNSPDYGLVAFLEEKMQITDTSVFDVFDFHLVQGDESRALVGPNKAVISEKAAEKYFGQVNPIGKTLRWGNGEIDFEVTGVFRDVPVNSHIKFDFLFSYETMKAFSRETAHETSWGWYDFNTYVLVQPGTDVAMLQAKWDKWLAETRQEDWKRYNGKQEFILQPLLDIHLGKVLLQESQPDERGNRDSVYALSFVALFILVIAWVNYINLATARSFDRANEVGVRKVMGAVRNQLIYQFMAESFLVNLLAAALSVGMIWLAWPVFADLCGRPIPVSYLAEPEFWTSLLLLFAAGSVLSGFYPAIVLSSFKPVSVLKGKVMRSGHGHVLRQSLVVFQFAASVCLIVGSLVVYEQVSFMRNRDLGVDIVKTLVVKSPGIQDSTYARKMEAFKTEALRIPGVKSMTASTNVPGDEIFWASGIRRLTRGPETNISGYTVGIDQDYVAAFGLKVIAGRGFDREHPDERKNMIINRSMAEALDWKDPHEAIGQKVVQGDTFEIVGVLENYHQMSLKESITPLVYRFTPEFSQFFAFKVQNDNYREILAQLEEPWKNIYPGNPVDYFLLDQFFNRQYEGEQRFGRIFGLFTLLAIFIACMGLFGLASFMTMQRTKEIGIRKVLGSTTSNIVLLLSRGFIQLVLIGNLIAWPLAWYVMNRWLDGFPYHISIPPVLFLVAGTGVVVIAFLSVGFQTLKAALVNPAQTLKYE
ncbi:MAG: ABC transporter permease [Cyclobacteriaceae bacterium]|nr:ABC transporter permease [Cyclobacteriaceae bacterium]